MDTNSFKLMNGIDIPAIGYGTGIAKGISKHPFCIFKRYVKEVTKTIFVPGFKEQNRYPVLADVKKDKQLRKISQYAAEKGCRLFDTARAYAYSESYLGESLISSGIRREDFFLITKVTNAAQRNKTIMNDFETSLKNLKTDYVDLYLMHWPQSGAYLETWKEIEKIYKSGRARAIGISNCHIHHMEAIKEIAEIMPMVNEIECHPMLQQNEIRDYCKSNNIKLIAHTPTGKLNKKIVNSDVIKKISTEHNVSVSQIILRWHYQLGDISIPNTSNAKHLSQNLEIWDFELSDNEMEEIKLLDCGERIWPDPDNCDFTKL